MILRYYIYSVIILLIYLYNYFPVSLNNNKQAIKPPELKIDNKLILKPDNIYTPSMHKLILVVIDALREDFVTKESMPFLKHHVEEKGCLLSTTVKPPTVTMPRIKSLTTGTIPQFADLVLNFASSKSNVDSILKRFVEGGKKIIFYGDDTWLKLYPEMFVRSEGTSSFFVTDFTEVDNNVTRNIPKEMRRNDWDFMILHYLGLDHIGHLHGPKSPLIKQKLFEMDKIINELVTNSTKNTLILVTGDHGMRDSGGHGSTTVPEIQVPTAVIGLKCFSNAVAQIDLAPTISVLFGFPIPSDSIGRVLSNLLYIQPVEKRLYALHYNFKILSGKSTLCDEKKGQISSLLTDYYKNGNITSANNLQSLYDYCNQEISNELTKGVQTNVPAVICLSLFCFFVATTADLLNATKSIGNFQKRAEIVLMLSILFSNYAIAALSALICCMFLIERHVSNAKIDCTLSSDDVSMFAVALAHNLLLNATSFIEEEHQICYHVWGTVCLLQIFKQLRDKKLPALFNWTVIFVGLRIFRHLNRTGDKWATVPDISDWLTRPENEPVFKMTFLVGLLCLWYYCFELNNRDILCSSLSALLMVAIYYYHFVIQSALVGKIMWLIVLATIATRRSALFVWILMCSIVMRSYNILLLPFCIFVGASLRKNSSPSLCISLHYWLSNTLFFCQGNGNNFAHADVATGYVGLKEYNLILVSLQVLINSYAFPILCVLMLFHFMPKERHRVCQMFAFYRLGTMATVCLISYMHQNHLFIWSVFAPKLIIESIHCVVLFIPLFIVNVCDMTGMFAQNMK